MTSYPPPPGEDDPSGTSGGYPPGPAGHGADDPGAQPPPPGQSGYGYPPGGYGYGSGYGGSGTGPTNTKAVWALVVGLVSLPLALCCSLLGLAGIASIVLGRMARQEIEMSGGLQRGAGMAKAGFILGIVDVVLALVMFAVSIVLFSSGNGFQINTAPAG
ncbi:MAG: DUF4190 domain-containing protein [Nocardioidaceae bacterium]